MTNQFTENSRAKSAVCKELDLDLMIEDNPEHAFDCAAHGIPVVLHDKKLNEGVAYPLITRVDGWAGTLEYLRTYFSI